MTKPKILLTNDDGIYSKGLKSLWEALRHVATLQIVAPMKEQSGTGVGITFNQAIQTRVVEDYEDTPAWMVDGKPADCVKLALHSLLDEKPDYILSGINHGSNAGRNVLYSGTIGAIIEGVMCGISGIAFSYQCGKTRDFPHVQPYIVEILQHFQVHPLPSGTILNVNFPHVAPDQIKGCKMARQGLRSLLGTPRESFHLEGHSQFFLDWDSHMHDEHHESDIALLEKGYITAVPLSVGELTDYRHIEEKKKIFDDHFFPA